MENTEVKNEADQPTRNNVHPVFNAILNLICPPPDEALGRNQAVRAMLRKFEEENI